MIFDTVQLLLTVAASFSRKIRYRLYGSPEQMCYLLRDG